MLSQWAVNGVPGLVPHTFAHTETTGLTGLQRPPSRSAICGLTSGPNPPTRGAEEEGLGRDSALCECKQKSPSTMNNKSIQRKKESLFRGQTAASQQLLAERGLARLPRGYRATPMHLWAAAKQHDDQENNRFDGNADFSEITKAMCNQLLYLLS